MIPAEEYHFERDALLSANAKARSASTSTSTSTSTNRDRSSWHEAEPNEDEEEGTDLAIEDGAVPLPLLLRSSGPRSRSSNYLVFFKAKSDSHRIFLPSSSP